MNRKFLTIQVLKQRVNQMQSQITKLESKKDNCDYRPSDRKSRTPKNNHDSLSPSSFRSTPKNQRYKSPTFWTGNPLTGAQNPYKNSHTPSPRAKRNVSQSRLSKSPALQKIITDVDAKFYQSAAESERKQNLDRSKVEGGPLYFSSIKSPRRSDLSKRPVYFGKRYENRILDLIRPEPRVEKKRTYSPAMKDPILNPQPMKVSSKKLIQVPCRSPENMYTQNPRSNSDMYFNSSQPISLSPKMHNNRNNSPNLKLLLSSSQENLKKMNQTFTSTSHRKHYGRYYEENLASKWSSNW